MTSLTQPRELSVVEILGKSVGLYLSRFGQFMIPLLLIVSTRVVLWQLMDYFVPDLVFPLNFSEEFFLQLINYLMISVPISATFIVIERTLIAVSSGVCVKYSSDVIERRQPSVGAGFGFVVSKVSSLLAAGFITAILTVLGLVLFVVPGVIVAVAFSLPPQVIMIERLSAFESLRRSRKLVAERWGKTFAVLLVVSLVSAATYVVGDMFGDQLGILSSSGRWIATSIATSVTEPLYAITLTYLYYSLRIKEKLRESEMMVQPMVPAAQPPTRSLESAVPAPRLRFCYKCGQSLPSNATYCPHCGVRVRP